MERKTLLALDSPWNGAGIGLEIVLLPPGSMLHAKENNGFETVVLLLSGSGALYRDAGEPTLSLTLTSRTSLLDKTPTVMSLSSGTDWAAEADAHASGMELAIITTKNEEVFEPVVVLPQHVADEERGQGLGSGAMHRKVRAVLGDPLAPMIVPESNLVVGEVVNFPGRWSSYPPHGHPHPEVYYYRFPNGGFGVSVQGDGAEPSANVARVVRDGDVEQILDGFGHAQVAAPGYPMWYLWVVRHLPGNRYEGNPPFSYFSAHEWVNDPDAEIWTPDR